MKKRLAERLFEMMRLRTHVKGNILDSVLAELHQGLKTADTTMVLSVRPLGAINKRPMQCLFVATSFYFAYFFYTFTQNDTDFTTRHVRFRVLETRAAHKDGANHVGMGVSKVSLLHNMCDIEGVGTKMDADALFISTPSFIQFNGWSMTSSLDAGSEPLDPVRFELSVAVLKESDYTLSQCLVGNSWRTPHQVAMMSHGDQRAAVVDELSKVSGSWCAANAVSKCEALRFARISRSLLT